MILTCPNCATDFFVDDHLIGPDGRQVKCDECGDVWMAGLADPTPPTAPLPAASKPEQITFSPLPLPSTPMFAAPKPSAPQRAPLNRRRLIITLLIVALVVVGLIVLQGDIVKAWPAAANAYRALGLTAGPSAPGHG